MYSLIEKKKNGGRLTREELCYIVRGYTKGDIPDYQMSSFLMAVCFTGMDDEETYHFTIAMRDSGEQLDLSGIKGVVVDKHSTGGVGDKVSLVMGPMVAACGVPVAKMSGRGLGHTGGTIDKLESFTGFNTAPSGEEFIRNVNEISIAWAGQTANLAPADKKIYALRDVTATVDSMPLIASSIMSKKLASGAAGIVLDVTYGSGAFMKTPEEAMELARLMISIGKAEGKKMAALITSMEEPLGCAVGNALEVIEAIEVLQNKGPGDVLKVSVALGSRMLLLNGRCQTMEEAEKLLMETIETGSGLEKMAQWIERQGGDKRMVYDSSLFEKAGFEESLIYEEEQKAWVAGIDGRQIGMAVTRLGGGRQSKEDKIDLSVGVRLLKKTGDRVKKGDVIAKIYGNAGERIEEAKGMVMQAYEFSTDEIKPVEPIYGEL